MSARDYYSVLGVARGADADEIQRAYRKLAKKYHPDVSKEPNAEDRFKEVGEAYEVLKDPEKRTLYDQWGNNWEAVKDGRAAPGGPGGFDFSNFGGGGQGDLNSIFDQMFGGGGGARRSRRRRPPAPQETPIELGVSQAFEGGRREITFRDANGERRRLTVGIPKGVREGQKIRLAGQASTGGDLFLVVKLVKDAQFDVRGPDLVTKVRIPPWDAVLGVAVTVPTLEGEVRIKVPPGSSGGRQIRLRGRGYPLKGGSQSDLYAELSITIPETVTDAQRALWEQLRDHAAPDEAED